MKSRIAALIGSASLLMLVGCGSSDPECGSQLTQDLVAQIAKENQPNKLTNYIYQSSGFSNYVKEKYIKTKPELANKPDSEISGPDFWEFYLNPEIQSDWNAELSKISYKITEIVTNSIDPQTKNVECQGKLTADSKFGGSELTVTFDAKPTSDGSELVTVYGLN